MNRQQHLVHRRVAAAHGASLRRTASHATDSLSGSHQPPAPGLRAWQLWMLFGLGWPSLLLFFLSIVPGFSTGVRAWLITWGWVCCGSWLGGTLAGLVQDRPNKAQAAAYQANLIMACIGSAIGCVFLTIYAYYNMPGLYVFALLAGLAMMYGAKAVLGEEPPAAAAAEDGAAADADVAADAAGDAARPGGEAGAGAAPANGAANGHAAGLQDGSGAGLSRAISAPQSSTVQLLEQAAAAGQCDEEAAAAAAGSAAPNGLHNAATAAAEVPAPAAAAMTMEQAAMAAGLMPVAAAAGAGGAGGGGLTFEQAAAAASLFGAPAAHATPAAAAPGLAAALPAAGGQYAGTGGVPELVLPPEAGLLMTMEEAVAAGYVQPDTSILTLDEAIAQGLVQQPPPGSPIVLQAVSVASSAASPTPAGAALPPAAAASGVLTLDQAVMVAGLMAGASAAGVP